MADSLNSSGQSSTTDSSEEATEEASYRPKGKKRLFQGSLEDAKKKRAKKERTRVKNLAVAYEALATTIGLYPLRGAKKRITHEDILLKANNFIKELMIQEKSQGNVCNCL